jgi:hypothetical protein
MKDYIRKKYLKIIIARNSVKEDLGSNYPHVSVNRRIDLINEKLPFTISRLVYYRAIRREGEILKEAKYFKE